MKSIALFSTLLFATFFGFSNSLVAQCDGTFRFVNNTGREVTDLHIEFEEDGAKLVRHNFPGRPSAGKANFEGPKTNGTPRRWDVLKGRLPNKGVATLQFESDDCRLRIKNWWWTVDDNPATKPYGEKRPGTNAAGLSLDDDLVAPGETVTGVSLRQPYTKERNGKNTRIGINDLHLVSRKRPTVLNKTKSSENAKAKVGGVFEEESITTCNCDEKPKPDSRPCKQVCKDSTGTFYVLNLKTTGALKLGQKVELELKGVEKEDLKWLWWTKDDHPYTGIWNKPDRGQKNAGVSEEDGGHVSGKPKTEWDAVVGNFTLPAAAGSRSSFSLGLFGGMIVSPSRNEEGFSPGTVGLINNAIFDHPDLRAQLSERLGGEFFLGDFSGTTRMTPEGSPTTIQYGVHLRRGLTERFSLEARGGYFRSRTNGSFPVTVFPHQTESTEEFYETSGRYQSVRSVQELSVGANFLLGNGPLRGGLGGFAAAQRIGVRNRATINQLAWELTDNTSLELSAQLRGIVQYRPFDRVFLEGSLVRSVGLTGEHAKNYTAFQVGIGLVLHR